MFSKMKLQTKAITFLSIIITAVSLSSLLVFSIQFKNHELEHIVEKGDYIASDLLLSTIDHLFEENYRSLDEIVAAHMMIPDVQSIQILNIHNKIVSSSDPETVGLIREDLYDDDLFIQGREVTIVRSVELYGQSLGKIYLLLSTERMHKQFVRALFTWIGVEVILYILSIGLAFLLVQKFLRPLQKILQKTNSIARGDFTQRMGSFNNNELDMIANALDTMTEAVLEREENNRSISREKTELTEYLNNIINSMSLVIFGLDENGCIIHWNDKVSALVPTPPGGLYNRKLTDLMEKPFITDQMIFRVIREKRKEVISGVILESHGEQFYYDIVILPLQSDNHYGAVLLVEDVSERKKYQEILIQSEKMLSIGGMAAGMAHEINNPLAGIMQNSQILERRLNFTTPASEEALKKFDLDSKQLKLFLQERKIYKFIAYIQDSGQRIYHIIQDILNYARKSDNSFSTVDLHELMEKAIHLALSDVEGNSSIHFADIEIVREYCDQALELFCDPNRIIQAFLNIFKNGAEAMLESSRARRFTLRTEKRGDWAVIEIEDRGTGISDDIQEHIFDPFFTTKKQGSGTGLGMSISYFIIVDHHKGKLDVETDGSSWTKFIISLPLP